MATREKHPEVADLLKAAGALPPPEANFEVDAGTLKTYVGAYHPERGSDIGVALNKDGKLTIIAGETFVLGALDKTTFRPLAFDGVKITFVVENGKVTGFNFKQGATTQFFQRVEAK